MGTFFRTDSADDSEPFTLKSMNSELNPSPLAQPPGEAEETEKKEEQANAPYESQISFTLDTICPWTYIAKKRLDIALEQFRASPAAKDVNFTIKYFPFQLYPEMSNAGEDKYEWYKREKYNNSPEQMEKYTTVMTAYGKDVGIDFNFTGTIANTLNAHRLLQHLQESPPTQPNPSTSSSPSPATLALHSLYTSYFNTASHPSSPATLLLAARAAGMDPAAAEAFIGDPYEGLPELKMLLQEQRGDGVDSVPFVVVEGRKRDFRLEGAREVGEYLKVLEGVGKEL